MDHKGTNGLNAFQNILRNTIISPQVNKTVRLGQFLYKQG